MPVSGKTQTNALQGEPHIQFLIRSGETQLSILAPVLGYGGKPPFFRGGQCTDY